MHYKHHLFMRGAKHFNPYDKRLIHHQSHHHYGGALVSDHDLLSMLSLHDHHNRRKTGGTVKKTRPYKGKLVFNRY